MGGFCYAALIAATAALGWRLVFQRTPYQTEAIAIWSCLFVQILQGFQIDTDHWRHLFLLLGALYGLLAATRLYNRRKPVKDAVIPRKAGIQEAARLKG
jgi:hypothetical protein